MNLRTVKFDVRKILTTSYGIRREFDIYWEYEIDGRICKAIIECKNYKSRVSIDRIDALIGKLTDFPTIQPIFATKVGYQSGAQEFAKQHNVELLVVREQNISDWTDENGQPLIRYIGINAHYSAPAEIHRFVPGLDASWLKSNTDIDTSKPINLSGLNNTIFVEDVENDEHYSLQQLCNRLGSESVVGRHTKTERFDDAYLTHPMYGRLRLKEYAVEYSIYSPVTFTTEIDFGDALVGIIECLQTADKKLVFRERVHLGKSWVVTENLRSRATDG